MALKEAASSQHSLLAVSISTRYLWYTSVCCALQPLSRPIPVLAKDGISLPWKKKNLNEIFSGILTGWGNITAWNHKSPSAWEAGVSSSTSSLWSGRKDSLAVTAVGGRNRSPPNALMWAWPLCRKRHFFPLCIYLFIYLEAEAVFPIGGKIASCRTGVKKNSAEEKRCICSQAGMKNVWVTWSVWWDVRG